jgi:hypothetical protein
MSDLRGFLLVPTLCVGTHICDAQRRGPDLDRTQSVRTWVPTQSVGTRRRASLR